MESVSVEQKVRDILERMEIDGAQRFSAGELVELANILSDNEKLRNALRDARPFVERLGREAETRHDDPEGDGYMEVFEYETMTSARDLCQRIDKLIDG